MDDISASVAGQGPTTERAETAADTHQLDRMKPIMGALTDSDRVSEVRSFLIGEPEQLPEDEKPRRRRPRAPRPISGPDEAALSWYFGQGLSIYEKSTFGPIVQKIAMDGYASTTCARCDGAGILDVGGINLDDKCGSCHGKGLEPHKSGESVKWCLTCEGHGVVTPYEVVVEHGGWCPSCRGTGSGSVERRAMRRPRCSWCRPEAGVKPRSARHSCPNCLGSGDEPLTAKPGLKVEESGGVIGNDAALTRFAITSRRADAVKGISPALHAALEAFYGDMGSRWALTGFGRLFALSHLTPAGKQLARAGILAKVAPKKGKKGRGKAESKKRNDDAVQSLQLNAQERIGVQANLQLSQFKSDRKKLLDAAREQAADLYARAANAWNSVSTSRGEQSATARLLANLTRLGHGPLACKMQLSSKVSSIEIARAKTAMRGAGYVEDEIAEAFRIALDQAGGGGQ